MIHPRKLEYKKKWYYTKLTRKNSFWSKLLPWASASGFSFSAENKIQRMFSILIKNMKKKKPILESLLHMYNKIFGFCQRKKNKPFFLKYALSKKQKELFWKLLVQKQVLIFLVYKNKRKIRPLFTKLWLKGQNLAHFVQEFAYTTKNKTDKLFFLGDLQTEWTQKQTSNIRTFFFFLSRQCCCARQ